MASNWAPNKLSFLVAGITDDSISEGQIAALTLAVYFQQLSGAECRTLTSANSEVGLLFNFQFHPPHNFPMDVFCSPSMNA